MKKLLAFIFILALTSFGAAQVIQVDSIFTKNLSATAAGAASKAGLNVTGVPYTGGTATTNFPQLYINSGTGPTTFSTAGTVFGLNAPSGFTGNLIDAYVNGGSSMFSLDYLGNLTVGAGISSSGDGVHAGAAQVIGNTTEPVLKSNSFAWGGVLSASFTSWGINPASAEPGSACIPHFGIASSHWSAMTCSAIVGADMTNNTVGPTQLAAQYSKGSCTEAWGGSGTSFALTSGDDAVVNNTCYNDSGVTRTITAVKCRSSVGSNTTTVNPTFGSAGTGTTILSGALTCGSSYSYSSTGTVSNASWTTGSGIDPAMGGTLTGTSIAVIVEYTF